MIKWDREICGNKNLPCPKIQLKMWPVLRKINNNGLIIF